MPDAKRQGRRARKVSPAMLERSALHYLQRFASSSENLRRVLLRKVERSARQHDIDREQAAAWVDELVRKLRQNGLLNDALYAEGKAGTLLRRGNPRHAIARTLASKGVASADIDGALAATARDHAEPDLAAAIAYARRRRLGPWRKASERDANRERDLAALARRGFSYDLAQKVVAAASTVELEPAEGA